MKYSHALQVIGFILLCQVAGALGSFFTVTSSDGWFDELIKPAFQPPDFLFAPVWISLYTLMGIALYFLYRKSKEGKGNKEAQHLVWVFLGHLFLNALWTPIFFGAHLIGIAFLILLAIIGSVIYIMIKSWFIQRKVTYLLIPYLLWLLFAAVLNGAIVVLNW